jgi:oligoribonuclease
MKIKHNALVWIDLEMSGLDWQNDVILEAAVIITDANLNIIAQGPDLIINQPDQILDNMNPWCMEVHGKSGLIEASKKSTITPEQAENEILNFLQLHIEKNNSPLCGNTVWFDKLFLQKDMPKIVDFLHYRVVDVTAFKIMISQWAGKDILFKKKNTHRALDDIMESIAELKFYREHFIKIPDDASLFKQSGPK